jgi:hypothetical protein
LLVRIAAVLSAVLLAAGCSSYRIVQTNIFSDEDGRVVSVDYGRGEEEHVNVFTSPVTGREMEFKSRLLVKVELFDGRRFMAWRCMNFSRAGTMYKSDNEKFMFLAGGFSCIVYERDGDGRYAEIYRGVICDTPESEDGAEEDKWRMVKPQKRGMRSGSAR